MDKNFSSSHQNSPPPAPLLVKDTAYNDSENHTVEVEMANLFTIDQVKLILNNSQSHILWSMKFITKTINAEKNPECYRGKEGKVVYF